MNYIYIYLSFYIYTYGNKSILSIYIHMYVCKISIDIFLIYIYTPGEQNGRKVYIQDCLRKLEYCDEVLYFL